LESPFHSLLENPANDLRTRLTGWVGGLASMWGFEGAAGSISSQNEKSIHLNVLCFQF
jgi:hypothetical protein